KLVQLLGGPKPYRQFSFDNYNVRLGNGIAHEQCKRFEPANDNLYLWGPSGVGKTHLAFALARRCVEDSLSVMILPAYRLTAPARLKDPALEQAAIDAWISAKVLVLDDLGSEPDIRCQLLKQILDGRDFQDRAGL